MTISKEEKRRKELKWHKDHDDIKGVIGIVPPLAPGEVNPMWAIQKELPKVAKRAAEALKVINPRKKKVKVEMTAISGRYVRIEKSLEEVEEEIDKIDE